MSMSKLYFASFKMLPHGNGWRNGKQAILQFGDQYALSIIDDGYGSEQGLYEIAVFKNGGQTEMPGITAEGDTVKGYLTESDVDAIIAKMYTVTGAMPVQV